ncbi:hypothetical protein [Pseudomonas lini]|uniref:hypothetical protein n=1 Tax=Pseudomonas lini TaxID=163011 RepID=UPI0012E17E1B|nr:hypothetical protein [Pseudomonas lini]
MALLALRSGLVTTVEVTSRTNSRYQAKADLAHVTINADGGRALHQFRSGGFVMGSYNSGVERSISATLSASRAGLAYSTVKSLISSQNSNVEVDDLTITAEAVLDAISEFGPKILNLSLLDSNRVQGEHLATVLRTSFDWRDNVPGWNEALLVARQALVREGVDPEDALYGLV